MSMNKIANLQLETTAQYQNLSQLNVQFWNQDQSTAILQFQITRNDYPLSLSEENVKVFIALETGDSFLVDDNFNYLDQLNGVISYEIPNDFMKLAKNVTGQVYVTTLDEEEVVVQRKFSFTVANDLIADLPAEDKIREIKYFSDMRAEVAEMLTKLNSDFEHMNDYVTQVQDTTQEGITSLTKLIDDKEKAYNDNHTAKMKELDDKGKAYSQQLDEDKQYMDEKYEAFKESVNGSGLVTTGESKDWQKYKLTVDDGSYKYVDIKSNLESYQALSPGLYYTTNVPITGVGQTAAHGFTTVEQREDYDDLKRITFRPYNSNQEFVMTYYNEWGSWENALANVETTQGSQAKATTAENNANTYTDTKVGALHSVLFEGSVNGVGQTINMTKSMYNYNLIIISGSTPAGDFDRPVLVNQNSGNNIVVNIINLVDSNGNLGSVYELKLAKTNNTTLTIENDVFYDYGTNKGSGPNANRFTIKRIEGWK